MNVNCVTDVEHSSHVCSNTALLCCWWHQRTYTRVTVSRCQGCPVQAYNRNITTSKVNINTLKHICTFTRTQTLTDDMIKLMARLVLLYMRIINVILLFSIAFDKYVFKDWISLWLHWWDSERNGKTSKSMKRASALLVIRQF